MIKKLKSGSAQRFQKIERNDPRFKPFLGHKFEKQGQVVHDFRCWICGKWYNYSTLDISRLIKEGRWDFHKKRSKHCGSSHCEEWNRQHEAHKARVEAEHAITSLDLFKRLKKKKLVA